MGRVRELPSQVFNDRNNWYNRKIFYVSLRMRRIAVILFFALALIPAVCFAQADLFKNLYFETWGTQTNQNYGGSGLDTLGMLDSSVHSVSVGSNGGAVVIRNRFKLDTMPAAYLPGTKVIRGNISGSGRGDLVIYDKINYRITVLFADTLPFVYDTALVLKDDGKHVEFHAASIAVANFDGSSYDGIVISDPSYSDSVNTPGPIGRILYWRGGPKLDMMPAEVVIGSNAHFVGGDIAVGKVLDTTQEFLVEQRGGGTWCYLYPLGTNFTIDSSADTAKISFSGDGGRGGMMLADVFGTGIDAILYGSSPRVHVYGGLGGAIPSNPSFYFSSPDSSNSDGFGTAMADVGNLTGRGYHSLVISDVDWGSNFTGRVYVFNLGKALKDSVVAWGDGTELMKPNGFENYFGEQIIGPGDLTDAGRGTIMVGCNGEIFGSGGAASNTGRLTSFLGDTSLGPSAVSESTTALAAGFALVQNYPNPCTSATDVTFAIANPVLYGKEITLRLYDKLGRFVEPLYNGLADGYGYTVRLNTGNLPAGVYFYRLSAGGASETKMLSVMR